MALHTKKLYYRRGGTTYSVDLYTTTAEVGAEYLTLRDGSINVYAKIDAVNSVHESHLRCYKNSISKSIISTLSSTMLLVPLNDSYPVAGAHCYSATISGDGAKMATGSELEPKLITYEWNDVTDRFESVPYDIAPAQAQDVAMSQDGNFLAVAQYFSSPYIAMYKWSTVNSRWEKTAIEGSSVQSTHAVSITPSGDIVAAGSVSSTTPFLFRWNSGTSTYVRDTTAFDSNLNASGCYSCAISSDGQVIAFAHTSSPYITTYRWSSGLSKFVKTANPNILRSNLGARLAISYNGDIVALGGATSIFVYKWSSSNSRYEKTGELTSDNNQYGGLTITDDSQYIIAGGGPAPDYKIRVFAQTSPGYYNTTPAYEAALPGAPQKCYVTQNISGKRIITQGIYDASPYVKVYNF
jgi:hypothetical protein